MSSFLGGDVMFVTLPTGQGKSLIYQICPVVAKELSFLGQQFPNAPLLVVICPLSSLISNQISSCERIGLKACKVEAVNTTSLLNECNFDIVFASLEVLYHTEATNLLQQYCERIIGVVVDESHCVVQG